LNRNPLEQLESFEQQVRTYITHNKGASWELLKPPERDMKYKNTKCLLEDGCSLNLQMYYDSSMIYASPYSTESAIGIMMAVGSLGTSLPSEKGAQMGTYLSRDGGLNWQEVAKIPLIYEFGDHGGLLVAAPNVESTKTIRYSWDEGKTWTKVTISDKPLFVQNIIIEPKSTSLEFILYGSYDNL
jgi:hypothetical protein